MCKKIDNLMGMVSGKVEETLESKSGGKVGSEQLQKAKSVVGQKIPVNRPMAGA